MEPRVRPIAERWDRVTEYLVEAARAVDAERWSAPSPYPGWSYKDLLVHLATGYTVRLNQLHSLLEKGRLGPEPEVDAAIAGHIERHRKSSPEAVVEEMIRQRSEVRRLLGLLRPEHLETRTTIQRPRDQAPREGPFLEALEHYHAHDLEHAADLAPVMRWRVTPPEL
jgi:uncharacterized damage-inducible protein DinB